MRLGVSFGFGHQGFVTAAHRIPVHAAERGIEEELFDSGPNNIERLLTLLRRGLVRRRDWGGRGDRYRRLLRTDRPGILDPEKTARQRKPKN